jgi:hypothetical protein
LLFTFFGWLTIPQTYAIDEFTDFLPKYRSFNSNYQIDKIVYQKSKTVLFFRFIVQQTKDHAF